MFLDIIKSDGLDALRARFQDWADDNKDAYIVGCNFRMAYFEKDDRKSFKSSWISYNLFIYYDKMPKGETQQKKIITVLTPKHEVKHVNDVNAQLIDPDIPTNWDKLIASDCCFHPKKQQTGAADPSVYYGTVIIWYS